MVLISKKERRQILEHLFQEGVICVKKDARACRHNEQQLEAIPNLHVMMVLRSLCSKAFVTETFNWQWYYYYLTNEGIDYLRGVLNLPPQVMPSTLTKQRPTRPALAGADQADRGEGKGWGKGKGKGKGYGKED
mmetsp:Transcript_16264/g.42936  ORF Transcript_16264/g.42936 Transcript_16264/m.42936 type:complete len:134 (-) Transcript_16264:51-452(-)